MIIKNHINVFLLIYFLFQYIFSYLIKYYLIYFIIKTNINNGKYIKNFNIYKFLSFI